MGTRWNKFGTLFLISCDYEIIIYSHYFIHDFLLIVLGDGFKDSVFLSRSLSECPSFKSIFCELTSPAGSLDIQTPTHQIFGGFGCRPLVNQMGSGVTESFHNNGIYDLPISDHHCREKM